MKTRLAIPALVLAAFALLAQVTTTEEHIQIKDVRPSQVTAILSTLGLTNVEASRCLTIRINCRSGSATVTARP